MRITTMMVMRQPVISIGRLFANASVIAINHAGTQWTRKMRMRSPRSMRSIKGIRGSKANSRNKVALLDDEQVLCKVGVEVACLHLVVQVFLGQLACWFALGATRFA